MLPGMTASPNTHRKDFGATSPLEFSSPPCSNDSMRPPIDALTLTGAGPVRRTANAPEIARKTVAVLESERAPRESKRECKKH
jgi:hypothetical protein